MKDAIMMELIRLDETLKAAGRILSMEEIIASIDADEILRSILDDLDIEEVLELRCHLQSIRRFGK